MKYLNVLIAYPYWDKRQAEVFKRFEGPVRFVLDSGAFTSWKSGKQITLDEYCRFIETLPIKPWRYFMLDVIGDPEATLRNYETMLKRGFDPIPVFTRGEDPSVLEHYYENSEVVGLGGLVYTSGNIGYLKGIMEKVGKRKAHWLGFTRMEFLNALRPYMCDSSTWEAGARFGTLQMYMGNGKFARVSRTDFNKKPSEAIMRRISELGHDPYKFAKEENWRGGGSMLRKLCASSGVAQSLDVEKHLGTKFFLALCSTLALELVVDAYNYQTRGARNVA